MKRMILTLLLAAAAFILVACDEKTDYVVVEEIVYVYDEDVPPPVPQGVYSITGDGEVLLYWLPVDDVNGDLATYVVYRSDYDPIEGYLEIGTTGSTHFVDRNVINGQTYYYAVSSLDVDGNLSDLSYEMVLDTPRPQGINRVIFDCDNLPDYAGWDLSGDSTVFCYDSNYCDFYLEWFPGDDVFYFNVGHSQTDVQDMGYTETLDDIDYAPIYGWSKNGWVEIVNKHTYVFWTKDNNFAKVRVTAINADKVIFDWAYQVAPGNPELKPLVDREADYMRNPDGGR